MHPHRSLPNQPGTFRELWAVAMPLVLSSGSLSLMHVIDRVFLTWHSTDALAAAMPAGMMHWTVISVVLGMVTYVNTFVAQYDGAGRTDRAAAAVWQGCYLSLFSGVLFLFVVGYSEEIFALLNHAASVQRLEAQYFSILCVGSAPVTLSCCLSCFFSGRGDTKTVMYVNLVAVAVNGVLAYGLIFGKAGLPQLGIAGAGLATVFAHLAAVAMYVAMLLRRRERIEYGFWRNRGFDRELFGRLLRYGLPTGFQYFAEISGFTVFIFLVGSIGKNELAATSLAFNLNSLAFIPMLGFGTAVMTLVGKRIGEKRPALAVRTTWIAFGLTATYMLTFAAIYVFLPDAVLALYSLQGSAEDFGPIRELVYMLLRFVALYSFFDAMAIVFGSAVRGAGDTRFSLVFTAISGWSLMVVPTAIAFRFYGGNLTVSWAACSVYVTVVGLGFLWRFQSGKWKSMRVIEESPNAAPRLIGQPHFVQRAAAEMVDMTEPTIASR